VSVSVLAAAPAFAQAPQVEKNVSMALSMAMMQGALDQCTKDGFKVSVVVVDKGGNVAASVRGDGTPPHTMEFARMKAYTARTRRPDLTADHEEDGGSGVSFPKQIPNVVGVGGGVSIKAGNEVIGGLGVSAAPGGEKDESMPVSPSRGRAQVAHLAAQPVLSGQSCSEPDFICLGAERELAAASPRRAPRTSISTRINRRNQVLIDRWP
jgi:uncharacterized protein GlcG (DUF336 family)